MPSANWGQLSAGQSVDFERPKHHDGRVSWCLAANECVWHEDCGELSTGEYHAQYERSSGWVWTGGLEARQGVGTQDCGSPYTTLKQNSKTKFIQRRVRSWGSTQDSS